MHAYKMRRYVSLYSYVMFIISERNIAPLINCGLQGRYSEKQLMEGVDKGGDCWLRLTLYLVLSPDDGGDAVVNPNDWGMHNSKPLWLRGPSEYSE
jgi:hypothetical protein